MASGIHTLSDLNKSGMLVQDPSENNEVDAIFNQVRQQGAEEGPLENLCRSGSSFTVNDESDAVVHCIVFWSNGFTVNDGPLRRLDDPKNASFLESIRMYECPKDLEPEDRSTVDLHMIRTVEAHPGVGRTAGSCSNSTAAEPFAASALTTAPTASPDLFVDGNLPLTSIQLRLADGTPMITRFNLHHTVNDIRTSIDAARPGIATNYQLQMMGFPPKLLTDPTQTIESAGLANSVVIQKF